MSILNKISWKTRRWNYTFDFFTLYLRDQYGTWGFEFIRFGIKLRSYSLLAIKFRLPDMTYVKRFTIDDWDFLFLNRYLFITYDKLSDRKLWNPGSLRWYDRVKLNVLNRIIK